MKPFVRYNLSADITDRGIGFSIKRAVLAFMKSNGYEARISDFNASSNNFNAILELFYSPGTNPDFNTKTLLEHLSKSGRMPMDRTVKPENVTITPMPCDFDLSIPDGHGHEACQKTIDSLNGKNANLETMVRDQEKVITSITQTLEQRQRIVTERDKQIGNLEAQLKRKTLSHYDDPALAIADGYIAHGAEDFFDASEDFEELARNKDLDTLLKFQTEKPTYVGYINAKYGLGFSDEKDFNSWMEQMKNIGELEQTQDYQKIEKEKKKIEANRNVLEVAEQTGASDEVISALKKAVEEGSKQRTDLDNQVETLRQKHERERESYATIVEPVKAYQSFIPLFERTSARKESKKEISFLIDKNDEVSQLPPCRIFMPSVGQGSGLEKYVSEKISSFFDKEQFNIIYKEGDNTFGFFEISPKKEEYLNDKYLEKIGAELSGDKVLNALGIKPRFVFLRH